MAIGYLAANDPEVLALNALRDRSRTTCADINAVDRPDRSDLGRGAAEEQLVRHIQKLTRQHLFANLDAKIARDRHHGIPRDTLQDSRAQRRGKQTIAAHGEEILATALGDEALGIEHDAFGVLVRARLHLRQLRVEVVTASLGHARKSARSRAA